MITYELISSANFDFYHNDILKNHKEIKKFKFQISAKLVNNWINGSVL